MAGERDRTRDKLESSDSDAEGDSGRQRRGGQTLFGEARSVELWINEYEWEAAARDRAARERALLAEGRDQAASVRTNAAAIRAEASQTRYTAAITRARATRLRMHPMHGSASDAESESADTPVVEHPLVRGEREDREADDRDRAADRSDRSITRRERVAERRDFDRLVWLAGDDLWQRLVRVLLERADRRDQLAELRDRGADRRDQVAAAREYNAADAHRDRLAAAADRINSGQDRDAAAADRAELIAAVRDLLELARGGDRTP